MCVIVAKYFKDTGWAIAKNRDQNYVSTVTFKDKKHKKMGEIFTLYDHDIHYQEGCNYKGLVIITTSLVPIIVEETDKEDGELMVRALTMFTDPDDAADYLIKNKLVGFIACMTPEKFVMVEAAKEQQGKGPYRAYKREIPKNETFACTNHGIYFPWAGFQSGYSEQQDIWRKSSETRLEHAKKAVTRAKNIHELIDNIADKYDEDLQHNVFRVENKPGQMRTIFQWAFDPKNHMIYIRPIQTKLSVDVNRDMIKAEILDNEIIKKRFDGKIKHFTKLKPGDEDGHIKSVKTEQFLKFNQFIKS